LVAAPETSIASAIKASSITMLVRMCISRLLSTHR
jgi:hypothetical protein